MERVFSYDFHPDNHPAYLREYIPCRSCGCRAQGDLIAVTNRTLGPRCKLCATKEIAAQGLATRERREVSIILRWRGKGPRP
jgi:hypothetical protein